MPLMASLCSTGLTQESLCALLPLDTPNAGQDDLTEARTDARSIMSPCGSMESVAYKEYEIYSVIMVYVMQHLRLKKVVAESPVLSKVGAGR
ncbi:hypothetical protein AVEN_126546-1 [Araneus ventricosus]|uniref:Uncharacterized protein n=1 Tax=Araneus ventricosus TaxID=182803 RepID=A0A4Y2WXW8_ARAVE|nr:hypothetical protein AVEN_126546-1 [Araneus ventricosus]